VSDSLSTTDASAFQADNKLAAQPFRAILAHHGQLSRILDAFVLELKALL